MEIAAGVHRVEAPLGDRYVALYLIVGSSGALLVDTGVDHSVRERLVPYLERLPLDVPLRYAIGTHCDFDHVGGAAALREASPSVVLMCGEADRPMVDDLERMIGERYGEFAADHGYDDSEQTQAHIRSVSRTSTTDIGLRGGERISLGDREVEILHTPGHSWGHLSVHDVLTGAVIIGDAILGNGLLTAGGEPAFPPTYRDVEPYRSSIARLRALQPSLLLTAHYPVMAGRRIQDFLDLSAGFTEQVEQVVLSTLDAATEPLTLLEVVDAAAPALGTWEQAAAQMLVYPILGHLEVLERGGRVVRQQDGQWHRFSSYRQAPGLDRVGAP